MRVEGKGWVEPHPVIVPISRPNLDHLRNVAEERSRYRGYSVRPDAWGRGFSRSPVLTSLVGEHAFCLWCNEKIGTDLVVDTKLRPRGDGGIDFNIRGVSVQLKTCREGGSNLERSFDSYLRHLNSSVYVFSEWREREMRVYLRGWIETMRMITDRESGGRFEHARASGATHYNLNVPTSRLKPMSEFAQLCLVRGAA